mmetsp:Transcript_19050/g.26186  ORF Transcript_19050/g.26186 Transcript_19050/m.26186 type:complete len:164 (+) Transcript_19050:89-580(+)
MKTTNSSNSTDLWRDTPIRFVGYANEVGEAFRSVYPKYLRLSYIVAFGYVGCDAADKIYRAINDGASNETTIKIGADVLIWQTFASVIIPGKTIHLIASATNYSVNKLRIFSHLPFAIRKWAPTAVGLVSIPLIIHPIDTFVTNTMDQTVRKWNWTQMKMNSN